MTELTKQEQQNIRVVLRVLSVRHGGFALLAARIEIGYASLRKVFYGMQAPGARIAIRIAQFAGVPVEDVLSGTFPGPGVCRHCGHAMDEVTEETPDVH